MATNRFLIVGKYAVGSNKGLHDVDLVDTRVRGGGIKEELVTGFKGAYPQVRWFHDIGHYDGTPFPGATAVLADLPASLLEVSGGVFNKKQIDSIVKHHLSFGIYPVIRFYCTNTGLVKHETVAGWLVEDGLTCPTPDGEVICTAPNFFESFTGDNDSAPDTDHWDVTVSGTSTCEIQDNQLQMYIGPVGGPGGGGGDLAYCDFIDGVSGDLDISFDYELLDYPNEDFWSIQLGVSQADFTSLTLVRGYYSDYASTIEGQQYRTYRYDPDPGVDDGYFNDELTMHKSGKMRITRVGKVWTSYYWDGSEWVINHQFTAVNVSTDATVTVRLRHGLSDWPGGNPPAPAARVKIDNFSIWEGTLV